jgi:hypothetical protein
MGVFHMFNIAIIYPFIAILSMARFRCSWGSIHYPPLIYLFLMHLHRKIPPTLRPSQIMQLFLLKKSSTSNNRFMTSFNRIIPSARQTTTSTIQAAHQGLDQKTFPHIPRELDAMETIASQGGRIGPGGYKQVLVVEEDIPKTTIFTPW